MLRSRKPKPKVSEPDLFDYPTGVELTEIWDARNAVEFVLAGKAKITIKAEKSGKHYTYKIKKGDGDVWFVQKLTSDNKYFYIGTIFPTGFAKTRKSPPLVHLTPGFVAFDWFWERLNKNRRIPPGVKLFHAGKCGMCGLELTDPVSIKEGYGPDCRKKRVARSFMGGSK